MKAKKIISLLILPAALSGVLWSRLSARADVALPALFSDGMILQRNAPIPVWGTANAGETVSVALGDQKKDVITDSNGRWMTRLAPVAGGGPLEMTVSGKNTLMVRDILMGEVWLASGQSNMELRLPRVTDAEAEIAKANYPLVRMFRVARKIADEPQTQTSGKWQSASPQTASEFTAVGYFFARELHQKLGVPIGLIHASYGGTPAQAWTRKEVMESNPALQSVFTDWQKTLADYPEAKARFDRQMESWTKRAAQAKAEGKPEPSKPLNAVGPGDKASPSGLYNGMIAPVIPYGIKGVIWYQGESNTKNPELYRDLFPALINDWRARFGAENLPFLWVQLANFHKAQTDPAEQSNWAELREVQDKTLALPNTGQAITIDIGEADDIHYRNKQDAGKRLALVALATQYGQTIEYSGPRYDGMEIEKGAIRLKFTHAAGLTAKDGDLKGFAIAGQDGVWVWGNAKIDGTDILVSNPQVPAPLAVRYDWADNPIGNLYNAAGLPAAPFRTDSK